MPNEDAAAIQEDVANDESGTGEESGTTDIILDEPIPPEPEEKSSRDSIMDQIAARRSEELTKEGVEFAEALDADADIAPAPEKVPIKVDGVESEISKEDLSKQVMEYQKHKAADTRLDEAAQRQKDLDDREAAIAAREASIQTPPPPPPEPAAEPVDVDGIVDGIMDSVFNEDREGLREAVTQLLPGGQVVQQPVLNQGDIDAAVERSAEKKNRVDRYEPLW